MRLTHIDLFSGIGGFALAARWAGIKTIQFVEIDKRCRDFLARAWPGVTIHDDIKTFHWGVADTADRERVKLVRDEVGGGGMTITSNIAELQAELNKLRRERDLYRMTLEVLSKETPNLKYLNQFWCKIAQEALKDERIS